MRLAVLLVVTFIAGVSVPAAGGAGSRGAGGRPLHFRRLLRRLHAAVLVSFRAGHRPAAGRRCRRLDGGQGGPSYNFV